MGNLLPPISRVLPLVPLLLAQSLLMAGKLLLVLSVVYVLLRAHNLLPMLLVPLLSRLVTLLQVLALTPAMLAELLCQPRAILPSRVVPKTITNRREPLPPMVCVQLALDQLNLLPPISRVLPLRVPLLLAQSLLMAGKLLLVLSVVYVLLRAHNLLPMLLVPLLSRLVTLLQVLALTPAMLAELLCQPRAILPSRVVPKTITNRREPLPPMVCVQYAL